MSTTTKRTRREPTRQEIDEATASHVETKTNEPESDEFGNDTRPSEHNLSSISNEFINQLGDFYLVGHHYGHEDQWERFREEGIWEQGKDGNSRTVAAINPGTLLILKTTATKGNVLILEGLGIVQKNPGDGYRLEVNWVLPKEEFGREDIQGLSAAFPRMIQRVGAKYKTQILAKVGATRLSRVFNVSQSEVLAGLTIISESEEIYLEADRIANQFAKVIHRSKEISNTGGNRTSQEDRFYGIFGQWGRGKTKFWNLLKDSLKELKGYRFIEFHAWKYQETPAVWAYLYEKFADEYYSRWSKFYPFYTIINWFQSFWLSLFRNPGTVSLFALSLLATFAGLQFNLVDFNNPELIDWTASSLVSITGLIAGYKTFSKPLAAQAGTFLSFLGRKHFRSHLGVQHEAQEELRILLKAWYWLYPKKEKKNIVLFIDDIDRCDEKKIIQIVDCIRVMLNEPEIQKNLIVIAAIDERILCQAIRKKYLGFVETQSVDEIEHLTAEYLDKLFIAGIKLGKLTNDEKLVILSGYTENITKRIVNESEIESKAETNSRASKSINTSDQLKDKNESQDNSEKESESFQLSEDEEQILFERVEKLKNATPRSIRGFLIRYRLARNLFNLLGDPATYNELEEVADLIVQAMNLEFVEHPSSDRMKQVIQMVDYYHQSVRTKSIGAKSIN